MTLTDPRQDLTALDLQRSAAAALASANRLPALRLDEFDGYWSLSTVIELLRGVDQALQRLGAAVDQQVRAGTLTVVDGPFADDPIAAGQTTRRWLERARTGLHIAVAPALDSAHITLSGLAHP